MSKYGNPFFNTRVVLLPPINTIVHSLFSFVNNQNNTWTNRGSLFSFVNNQNNTWTNRGSLFSFVNNQNNAWTNHGGWAMHNS